MVQTRSKRQPISKRLRFEVFKRDSFTCQYCGKSAPDVILHVDHIKPVKEGGENTITNLITACSECNMGKGATMLSDKSVVMKQKHQLDEINERREQLKLMHKWQEELDNFYVDEADYICAKFSDTVNGFHITPSGKRKVLKWIKKFGYEHVFDAISKAADKYLIVDDNGKISAENAREVLSNIPKLCAYEKMNREDPEKAKILYLRGIARNRFADCDMAESLDLITDMSHELGLSFGEIKDILLSFTSWRECARHIRENYVGEE